MLKLYSICSGSSGNAFLIQTKDSLIQIDCGGNKKQLLNFYQKYNINYHNIDLLLLTHNHNDHISQLSLYKDHTIYSYDHIEYNYHKIKPLKLINYKDISILPIVLSHDTMIVGYIIKYNNEKLIYITDTGYIKEEYLELFKDSNYIIIESNYDINLLMNSNRPLYLKQRILSDTGHLSNEQTLNIINRIINHNTKVLWFAHISQECNDTNIIIDSIKNIKYNIDIKCLKQQEETIWEKE